ncbi:MAG: zinc ribbon domain-containing protein [Acidobacteriota bacterium]|nr:zinc ribbon domain-containing protein [Acidobacteriota bacterium]
MVIVLASALAIGIMAFLLTIRAKDLPKPLPVSPFQHLDERKAAIYENLRDLQFEYRLGKLSDDDYQHTKLDLQRELAKVMAEVDRVKQQLGQTVKPVPNMPVKGLPARDLPVKKASGKKFVCPNCRAEFPQALKFCGECGKSMKARA